MQASLGIDLGGTKTALGIVDTTGVIRKRHQFPSISGDFQAYLQVLIREIQAFLKACDSPRLEGIGVGCAGQIELGSGKVHHSPNLGWHNAELGKLLKQAFPNCWVAVDNDVRVATLGEYLNLSPKPPTYVNVFLGTGIGSGIILHGRILRGAANSAGEIGQTTIHKSGPKSSCGYGVYEYYGSGNTLGRLGQEWFQSAPQNHPLLDFGVQTASEVTGRMVGELAVQGHSKAMQIVRRVAFDAGIGIANIINFLNPHVITYGGGLSDLTLVQRPLLDGITRHAIPTALRSTRILKSKLGGDAALIGAARLNRLQPDGLLKG